MNPFALLLTVLGIGFMIFIHELGHYLAARASGVRVLVFSLGFGPRLFGFRRNGTDYRVSLVPVGGFVMVAGADEYDPRLLRADCLNAKSIGARAFYYSGGVIMNLLFAVLAFPLVFHAGVEFTAPVIGAVERGGSAWQADLRAGDRIRRIDGKDIYAFENMRVEVALAGANGVSMEIERDGQRLEKRVQSTYDSHDGLRKIGVRPAAQPTPAEIVVDPDSPAARAGLRSGDRLLSLNGKPVEPADAEAALIALGHEPLGTKLTVGFLRDGREQTITYEPVADQHTARIGIRPLATRVIAVRASNPALSGLLADDQILGIDGQPWFGEALPKGASDTTPAIVRVRRGQPATELDVALQFSDAFPRSRLLDDLVLGVNLPSGGVAVFPSPADGPAAKAGLRAGDVVIEAGGTPVATWEELFTKVRSLRSKSVTCAVLRGTERVALQIDPTFTREIGLGVVVEYQREVYQVEGLRNAIRAGLVCSADLIKQTYVTLREMVVGDVSARNLSGVIQISRVTYAYAESGWARFIYFLALLSLNLAFINVLPIPVLDGGHLLFLLIEKIKGSPVSARVHGYSLTLGLVFVVGLMVFVTYNDIVRAFLIAYLRLLRAGLLLSPAADVTASLALCGLPWTLAAVRAAAASVCIYAAGMVLNDHADRARDAVARPERPIPRGDVPASVALLVGLGLLGAGIAISPQPWFHALLAALVLGYDYALKANAALGALTMGSLRGLNLWSASVVLAAPAPPALLYAAIAYGLYIVAVTLLGVLEDEPRVKPKAIVSLGLLPPVAALLAIGQTAAPRPAVLIAAGLLVALWFAAIRRKSWDQRAIRRLMTFLLLGTMLFTSLLCLGSGRPIEAAAVFLAALVGRRISRSIAVT